MYPARQFYINMCQLLLGILENVRACGREREPT